MTAGVPGTGLGGIFYLLSALWMPVRELYRTARGKSSSARWRLVGAQTGLAAGILGAMWATGWLVTLVLPETWLSTIRGAPAPAHPDNVLAPSPFLVAALVLGAVVLGTRLIHLAILLVEMRERLRTRQA